MAFLLEYVLLGLSFHLVFAFSQAETGTCKYDEYSIKSESGNLTCLACRKCLAGFGLFPQCGTEIKDNETRNECEPCVLGKTYSAHEDISSCKPCGSCADHQTVVKNCTLYSDSQCKDTCSKGFYFEGLTGECKPCSWCCSDGSNEVRSGCKDMPFYKQCDVNTAKNCKPKCQNDQYVVPGSKGGGHCQDCKACRPGTSPFPECGSVVENVNNTRCRVCIKGQTFSDNYGKSPCKPCTRCSFRQREILPCSLERDRVCSYCKRGFYRDDNSNECKRCSACCNNHRDRVVEKCVEQEMPRNRQCGHANSEEHVCPHSNFIRWLAGSLAGGIVIIISAVIYLWWKFCRKVTIVDRLDGSNPFLLSNEEKDDFESTLEGQSTQPENFISFDNSGVIVRFNDHESLPNEVLEITLEICWDEALPFTLLSDEVQLSPVIQFYPPGLKLSNPACVTVPHSALVDSSHGWNIGLKSAVFSDGAVVWHDKTVDRIYADNLSFQTDCLLSYVVVGTPVRNSYHAKKRFYCAVFGGQGKVGPNYTAYLYLFDECEASLQAISHMSLKQSYKTFPCVKMIFLHDDGGNGEFRCTFELTSDDVAFQICVITSLTEDPSGNYKDSDTYQWNQMVTQQGAYASKPLATLVYDHSDFVENIFQHLDTFINGAGHYEVIAKYFGFSIYAIRSRFEKADGGPSRAMIEAIVVRDPHLTVQSFAKVVEEKAHRKEVADLLRAYDLTSLKESL
ncbi:PREDICTED: uncharacterized protein LOC107337409 isoform X2 [Acropora digitifera]|uniref:uncharacterized protein LOC107337409 isoform X2 n=1 Tax=Acropora digitifera TaxID=70779 RepID=UPI00077AE3B6|nr:PREDICTED: uncharacterized protein LOC107337409 isoform X2 [Acropora digitifera]